MEIKSIFDNVELKVKHLYFTYLLSLGHRVAISKVKTKPKDLLWAVDPISALYGTRIKKKRVDHNRFTTRGIIIKSLEKHFNVYVGKITHEINDSNYDVIVVKDYQAVPEDFSGEVWFFCSGMPSKQINYARPKNIMLIGGKYQRDLFAERYPRANVYALKSALSPEIIASATRGGRKVRIENGVINIAFITSKNFAARGVIIAAQAVANLHTSSKKAFRLHVVGDYTGEADQALKDNLEAHNIVFHGFLNVTGSEFQSLMQKCILQIHLSNGEGQSGSVMTGLAYGLPAVVSRESYIDDMGFAQVITENTVSKVTDAILDALENLNLDREIIINQAKEKLSIAAFQANCERIIDDACVNK